MLTSCSRAGNATVKAPLSGFSDRGLAQLFGVQIDEPQPEPKSSRPGSPTIKKSAIIKGTVGGVAGLGLLIGALWFVTRQWRKMHIDVDELVFETDAKPVFEKDARPVFEKDVRSDEPIAPVYEKDVHPDVNEEVKHISALAELPPVAYIRS